MPGKRLKTHHDYNVLPDNEAEIPEAVNEESDETAAERFVSQFKPATDAPTNSKFYKDAQIYWKSLPPTLDTMLGGFNNTRLPRVDITGSRTFLSQPLIKKRLVASSYTHAVDCGAGIGRITKNLLSKLFSKTDLVDPIESFSKEVLEGDFLRSEREAGKIGQVFTMGLQEFSPEKGKYSVIWNQWCLGHLTDSDLVEYFKRCKEGLVSDGGVIIVKENLASGTDNFDGLDSSFTRTEKTLREIFRKSGLQVIHVAEQHGLPEGLYTVKMFALI